MTTIILAILIGAAFGAVLDRIGATNPNWIGKMLTLTNLHLTKTILLAIGTGSILMFAGQMAGLVDVGHMSVKTAYAGVFIGGLMLGGGGLLPRHRCLCGGLGAQGCAVLHRRGPVGRCGLHDDLSGMEIGGASGWRQADAGGGSWRGL